MEDVYKELGFKQPAILENPYGIRIYIGTKGEDDWAVEIPNKLCKAKSPGFTYDKPVVAYLITEEDALDISRRFTEIAKRMKKEK